MTVGREIIQTLIRQNKKYGMTKEDWFSMGQLIEDLTTQILTDISTIEIIEEEEREDK